MIDISKLPKKTKNGRLVYTPIDEETLKILKDMNSEIINKYGISLPDRNSIIHTLIQILTQGDYEKKDIGPLEFYIIRTDIKDFFPSINKHKLYQKIMNSHSLKADTINTIKTFIFKKKISGVPLGIPISTGLSELYLLEFDQDVHSQIEPYYYFRYVDDIILIKIFESKNQRKEEVEKTIEQLTDIMAKYDLTMNKDKTMSSEYTSTKPLEFEYLGYQFYSKKDKSYQLIIDISEKKYKEKIEKKIVKYFKKYEFSLKKDKDFWLLYYQVFHLLVGTKLRKGQKNAYYGFSYTYKFINTTEHLEKLYKTVHYYIVKADMSQYQKNKMWSILYTGKNSQKIDKETYIEFLDKKFNYNKLTENQINEMCTKIEIKDFDEARNKNDKLKIFLKKLTNNK